ncbi:MAG: flagellar basal body rod protein FlgB [candidate division Zixibacteria bacterium]|nr:flagellar basal body rod protein FlgB [candidate division Zixibacteria bacterium]
MFSRPGLPKFEAFMDLSAYRHKLISGNVANVSTPGYQAKDIDFKEEFSRMTGDTNQLAGCVTNPNHIPLGQNQQSEPDVNVAKISEGELNAVNIDNEISNLARNELEFTIAARILQRKFQGLKKAITSK